MTRIDLQLSIDMVKKTDDDNGTRHESYVVSAIDFKESDLEKPEEFVQKIKASIEELKKEV